jgi:hypothetical protein
MEGGMGVIVAVGETVDVMRRVGGGMGVTLSDGKAVKADVTVTMAVAELCTSGPGCPILCAQAPIIKSKVNPAKKLCMGFIGSPYRTLRLRNTNILLLQPTFIPKKDTQAAQFQSIR